MEKFKYVTILLFVFGIVEIFSYPQKNNLVHTEVEKFYEEGEGNNLDLQLTPFNQNGGRVKRDKKLTPQAAFDKDLKDHIFLTHTRWARENERLNHDFAEAAARFRELSERYVNENLTYEQAVVRFRRDQPNMARLLFGNQHHK